MHVYASLHGLRRGVLHGSPLCNVDVIGERIVGNRKKVTSWAWKEKTFVANAGFYSQRFRNVHYRNIVAQIDNDGESCLCRSFRTVHVRYSIVNMVSR